MALLPEERQRSDRVGVVPRLDEFADGELDTARHLQGVEVLKPAAGLDRHVGDGGEPACDHRICSVEMTGVELKRRQLVKRLDDEQRIVAAARQLHRLFGELGRADRGAGRPAGGDRDRRFGTGPAVGDGASLGELGVDSWAIDWATDDPGSPVLQGSSGGEVVRGVIGGA